MDDPPLFEHDPIENTVSDPDVDIHPARVRNFCPETVLPPGRSEVPPGSDISPTLDFDILSYFPSRCLDSLDAPFVEQGHIALEPSSKLVPIMILEREQVMYPSRSVSC